MVTLGNLGLVLNPFDRTLRLMRGMLARACVNSARRLTELLRSEEHVAVPGIVLQELLSGIPEQKQAERVLAAVRESFQSLLATEGDHLKAADLSNHAARTGVVASAPDVLIAAQVFNRRARLFTVDADFPRLAELTGVRLF